jgi:hypothetical protein
VYHEIDPQSSVSSVKKAARQRKNAVRKSGGLVKEVLTVKMAGRSHHLVSYHTLDDVKNKRLDTPYQDPRFKDTSQRPQRPQAITSFDRTLRLPGRAQYAPQRPPNLVLPPDPTPGISGFGDCYALDRSICQGGLFEDLYQDVCSTDILILNAGIGNPFEILCEDVYCTDVPGLGPGIGDRFEDLYQDVCCTDDPSPDPGIGNLLEDLCQDVCCTDDPRPDLGMGIL